MNHESRVPAHEQLILLLHVLLLALVPGCRAREQAPARDSVPLVAVPDSLVLGRWSGVLPCADCAGIRTELTLYVRRDSTTTASYALLETYLGTNEGDRKFESFGAWTIVKGSAADPLATIYRLDIGQPDELRHFLRLGDGALRQLDRNRQAMDSKLNYTLIRVP